VWLAVLVPTYVWGGLYAFAGCARRALIWVARVAVCAGGRRGAPRSLGQGGVPPVVGAAAVSAPYAAEAAAIAFWTAAATWAAASEIPAAAGAPIGSAAVAAIGAPDPAGPTCPAAAARASCSAVCCVVAHPPWTARVPVMAVALLKPPGQAAWCRSIQPLLPASAVRSAACCWMRAEMARCCRRMMLGRAAVVPWMAYWSGVLCAVPSSSGSVPHAVVTRSARRPMPGTVVSSAALFDQMPISLMALRGSKRAPAAAGSTCRGACTPRCSRRSGLVGHCRWPVGYMTLALRRWPIMRRVRFLFIGLSMKVQPSSNGLALAADMSRTR